MATSWYNIITNKHNRRTAITRHGHISTPSIITITTITITITITIIILL